MLKDKSERFLAPADQEVGRLAEKVLMIIVCSISPPELAGVLMSATIGDIYQSQVFAETEAVEAPVLRRLGGTSLTMSEFS